MSQYFSKVYRGFLIEQTDRGWVIPQLPSWSNGPVSQGPYSTYQIACGVLDRVLDNSQRETQKSERKEPQPTQSFSSSVETGPVEYLSISKELILYLIAYPLTAIFALSALFTFLSLFLIGKSPLQFLLLLALTGISFILSKKVLNYVYS